MASDPAGVPPPSPEHRRVAAGQFEKANQAVATGNFDYGIALLLSCCKLDPANLIYRQALRRTQKLKFKNNLRGSRLAWLTTARTRARIRRAAQNSEHLSVLEMGEQVLTRNPWDVQTQMAMAEAADGLGLLDLAVWNLEQARQKTPDGVDLNRALARLYEKRGNFAQAIALWEMVRKADPDDMEASGKSRQLAAQETIARGQYESAVSGASGRMPRAEHSDDESLPRHAGPRKKPDGDSGERPAPIDETASPTDKRLAREVAPLKARIAADPTDPSPYLQLAALHRRNGQLDQAREVLTKGAVPTGNCFEIAVEILDLEIEPFRRNLAITEERMEESPDEELRRIRVRLLKEINARELEMYRMKADRMPSELVNRFELGVRLLRAGQVDEAIAELQAARSDPRFHWKSLLYLGHCFKGRNNWKLARRNFDEALQHIPPSEDAARKELYYQLAQGCADNNDLSDAIDYASELANLDFGYRDIGALLDEWQERLKQDA